MYLGAYDACLFDKSLGDTLDVIAGLGLTSVEINSGGFLPPVHLPVDELRGQRGRARGIPRGVLVPRSHPHRPQLQRQPAAPGGGLPRLEGPPRLDRARGPARREARRHDVGHAGRRAGTTVPVWNPLPWWSPFLDVQDHQWAVAVPYWKDVQQRAADADVRIAIEMHPGNIVFNPRTMHRLGRGDRRHRTWERRWTRATCSGRGSTPCSPSPTSATLSTTRPPRTPGSMRPPRSTGSSTTPSAGSRRDNRATCLSVADDAQRLAAQPLVGLRRGRPRPRHGVLDRVPARPAEGRPRHASQHRARGPGVGPARGSAVRRADVDRRREGDLTPAGPDRVRRRRPAWRSSPPGRRRPR